MNTVVVRVICDKCQSVQEFHGQYFCDACKQHLSPFSIASQLLKEVNRELDSRQVQAGTARG